MVDTAPDRGADVRADEHEIARVLLRYAAGIDQRDSDLLRSCFTDECDLAYEGAGEWRTAAEIVEFMDASHAAMGHTLHRLTNLDVTVDGDHATARTYVDAILMAPDRQTGINPTGFYDDELVRTDRGWRIARRRYTAVRMVVLTGEGSLLDP